MRLTFIQVRTYVADAHRLRMTDDDQRAIESLLLARPELGPVMPGTGGLRKFRFAPHARGAGKSGGVRICYAYFARYASVYFITAFAKNEQANLTAAQKRAVQALMDEIERYLEARSR